MYDGEIIMRNTKQEVLLIGKTITGTLQGNIRPPLDVPEYVDFFMAGKLPIDKLITRNCSLDHISEAVQASEKER
jgi:Zn-dependent alcohol dehydrogenase